MSRYYTVLLLFLVSCNQNKTLNIFIENGSASQKTIPVEVYVNDSLYKIVTVNQGENVIRSKHIGVLISASTITKVGFKISNTEYGTQCSVKPRSLTNKTWMHVALSEIVFKKGYKYGDRILDKDTMLKKDFYCELVDQPLCGQVE